jgi:hypothetical protein
VPLLKPGGRIVMAIDNTSASWQAHRLVAEITYQFHPSLLSSASLKPLRFVPTSRLRRAAHQELLRLGSAANRSPWVGVLTLALAALPATSIALVTNLFAVAATGPAWRRGTASSLHLVVEVNLGTGVPTQPAARRSWDHVSALDGDTDETGRRALPADWHAASTGEGSLASLGPVTTQIWNDNPRRLAALLARYNFVAKMLSGRRDVGECGRGDAFGTRIVLEEVVRVTAYRRDPVLIGGIQGQHSAIEAKVHDILRDPLPRQHDAIFSLDVMDSIMPETEGAYLTNLWASLDPGGVLIIGTSLTDAGGPIGPAAGERRINRKTGPELQAQLKHYFSSVFLHSMNEEEVQVGVSPGADYLFAVCAGKLPRATIIDLSQARIAQFESRPAVSAAPTWPAP